jgi:hypothetical protein
LGARLLAGNRGHEPRGVTTRLHPHNCIAQVLRK